MILSYGAGLHGHEFSDPSTPQGQTFMKRSSLIRNSFFNRNPIIRRNTLSGSIDLGRPQLPRSSTGQTLRYAEPIVRFQEPTTCIDIASKPLGEKEKYSSGGSDNSSIISKEDPKERNWEHRMTSTFHLAHPAPTLTQTQKLLQIRPKLIFQLQLVTAQNRPKPSVDVLPSTVIVPRLANRLPRIFRGRKELGINDVIIVKSEDYEAASETKVRNIETDNDNLINRDLMAVICQVSRDRGTSLGVAEIVLSDGTVCVATPLSCGIYEFRTTDEKGCTMIAHWWTKNLPHRKSIGTSDYSNLNTKQKFVFSIMGPDTQKNSIMATITQKNLKIMDSYTTSPKFPRKNSPVPNFGDDIKKNENLDELSFPERKTHQIDKKMQTLIQVTGIWIGLRQGWSPYFKYDDAIAIACSTTSSQAFRRERSLSLTHTRSSQQNASTNTQFLKGISPIHVARRTSLKGRPNSKHLSWSETQENPQRVVSAGAAFIQRAAARKACHSPSMSSSDGHDEKISAPLRRAKTERLNSSQRHPTSPRLSLPGSYPLATPETPVLKQRAQSAYYPHPPSPLDLTTLPEKAESNEVFAEINLRHRIGRLKAMSNLKNFFRRMNNLHSRAKRAS
ncbi:hypothetical protein K3495_g10414 [Podosphaera aphanis]|nr:hypothetical protein K3495_g10414 [Podosphaera aphanis]